MHPDEIRKALDAYERAFKDWREHGDSKEYDFDTWLDRRDTEFQDMVKNGWQFRLTDLQQWTDVKSVIMLQVWLGRIRPKVEFGDTLPTMMWMDFRSGEYADPEVVESQRPKISVKPTSCKCGGSEAYVLEDGVRFVMLGCVCHTDVMDLVQKALIARPPVEVVAGDPELDALLAEEEAIAQEQEQEQEQEQDRSRPLSDVISLKGFDYEYWRNGERDILTPRLLEKGYTQINWRSGEEDSFGPLIRVCTALDPDGEAVELWYG